MPDRERWNATWRELGVASPPDQVFDELVARYSEAHRAYHTLRHLDECFAHLAEVRPRCTYPAEVELAIWFHDAVYDPRSSQHEELSAQWAERVVTAADGSKEAARRMGELVMATRRLARDAILCHESCEERFGHQRSLGGPPNGETKCCDDQCNDCESENSHQR